MTLNPTAKGEVYYGTSYIDGGIAWVLFSADAVASMSDEEIFDAVGFFYHHNGPGMPFAGNPIIWRTKRRVLVEQRFGYDC